MRLKHIKGSEETIKKSPYVVIDPEKHRGKWNNIFENTNPIKIEIGMGKGNFIIENALRYPNINFIGIDKYPSVLIKATERLENIEIPNLRLLCTDAASIETIFDHEIDTVYLNFSDPWPKNRHERRRLTSFPFLEKYELLFKEKSHITFKTDNRLLFEFSLISVTEFGYHLKKVCLDLYQELPEDNIPTEYERKFSSKGYPIYLLDAEK